MEGLATDSGTLGQVCGCEYDRQRSTPPASRRLKRSQSQNSRPCYIPLIGCVQRASERLTARRRSCCVKMGASRKTTSTYTQIDLYTCIHTEYKENGVASQDAGQSHGLLRRRWQGQLSRPFSVQRLLCGYQVLCK